MTLYALSVCYYLSLTQHCSEFYRSAGLTYELCRRTALRLTAINKRKPIRYSCKLLGVTVLTKKGD